jgi:hypothetical protein
MRAHSKPPAPIAEHLSVPITGEPLIAERFSFICGIGSPLAELRACWPDLSFDLLPDPWWPQAEETEEMIWHRSQSFRRRIAGEQWTGALSAR